MTVDNFKRFREILDFSTPESFYFLQILRRKKDGNDVTNSSSRYRKIKSYYISSLEEYDKYTSEIKELCKNNNARAYIRITPVTFYDVALEVINVLSSRIKDKQTFKTNTIYDSCCSNVRTCGKKMWLLDVDTQDMSEILKFFTNSDITILAQKCTYLETVNGYHILIPPFNRRNMIPTKNIELKIGNPFTLLYYEEIYNNR